MALDIGTIIQSDAFVNAFKGGYGTTPSHLLEVDASITNKPISPDIPAIDKTRKKAIFFVEYKKHNPSPECSYTAYYARRADKEGKYNPEGELIYFNADDERMVCFVDPSRIKTIGKIQRDKKDFRLLAERVVDILNDF